MKKHLISATALVLSVALSGCGGGSDSDARDEVAQSTSDFQFYNYLSATGSASAADVTAGMDAGILPFVVCPRPYDNNMDRHDMQFLSNGDLGLKVFRCDNMAEIVSKSQTVVPNKAYTVLAVGDVVTQSGLDILTIEQDRAAAPAGQVRLRFIHTLSQLSTLPVDVVVAGVPLVTGLQYKAASAYFSVTPDLPNGVTISIQQGGVELGRGVCVSAAGASYEAALAYVDFATLDPTVYCHPQ